jgi:hypothetical protein
MSPAAKPADAEARVGGGGTLNVFGRLKSERMRSV